MKKLSCEASTGIDRFVSIASHGCEIKPVKVVLELGSRDAEHAAALGRLFPFAAVYAFECDSTGIEACQQTLAEENNPNIKLVPKAVSNVEGRVKFFPIDLTKSPSPNPGASSLFKINPDYWKVEQLVQKETEVDAIRLDRFLTREGVSAVDVVWADLQGGELAAFEGLGELLSTVKILQAETAFCPIYLNQPLMEELDKFLGHHGLELVGRTKGPASQWFCDSFYRNSNLTRL